jgi:hypothetical protein
MFISGILFHLKFLKLFIQSIQRREVNPRTIILAKLLGLEMYQCVSQENTKKDD